MGQEALAMSERQRQTPRALRAREILRRLPAGNLVGAEIGVYRGDLSARLLRARPQLRLLLVDAWAGSAGASDSYKASGDRRAFDSPEKMDAHYEATRRAVAFAGKRASIVRSFSTAAAVMVEDASLDFVFIDADHSYEGCSADIKVWWPKVKPGGLLCGHDYSAAWPGVRRAVDEAVDAHDWGLTIGGAACWFVEKTKG